MDMGGHDDSTCSELRSFKIGNIQFIVWPRVCHDDPKDTKAAVCAQVSMGIVDLAITSRATTTRKTLRPSGGASSGVPSSLTGACCTVARTLPLPYLTINSVIIAPLRRTLGPLTMPGPIITCLPMLPFLYCPRGITRRSAVSVHLVQVWSLGIL